MEQHTHRVDVWDQRERLTLVRAGVGVRGANQTQPSVLTLRRLTRSVKHALYAGVPAGVTNPGAVAEIYLGLLVRAAIVGIENLTDADTGQPVQMNEPMRLVNGVRLCGDQVFDALNDLDLAMVIGVADSLLPPSKVREIAQAKLAEAMSIAQAVEEINSAVKSAQAEAVEVLKGN